MASGVAPSSFERPIYVGSTARDSGVKQRIQREHICKLTNGTHKNTPLQNYVNKNGLSSIVWFLLESCGKTETLAREDYYLQTLEPFADERKGFNICKATAASHIGRKFSAETRRRMSEGHKGKTLPAHVKAMLSTYRQAAKKHFWLYHPEYGTCFASGIGTFARARGISQSNLSGVCNGRLKTCSGWRLATVEEIAAVSLTGNA